MSAFNNKITKKEALLLIKSAFNEALRISDIDFHENTKLGKRRSAFFLESDIKKELDSRGGFK